ncbi:MAG: hypothetical protein WKG07_01310 [Hymenobacter sp.]
MPSEYLHRFRWCARAEAGKPGDEIIIYHKGIRYSYRVTVDFQDVKPNNTDSLKPTAEPSVTLSDLRADRYQLQPADCPGQTGQPRPRHGPQRQQ